LICFHVNFWFLAISQSIVLVIQKLRMPLEGYLEFIHLSFFKVICTISKSNFFAFSLLAINCYKNVRVCTCTTLITRQNTNIPNFLWKKWIKINGFVCLFVFLSVCLSVCLSVRLSVRCCCFIFFWTLCENSSQIESTAPSAEACRTLMHKRKRILFWIHIL